MMRLSPFRSPTPVSCAAFLCGGFLAAQGDDPARLLPADATVLARIESAQAFDGLQAALAPLTGLSTGAGLQSFLDSIASEDAQNDPAGLPVLATDRPLYVAVVLDMDGPQVTIVAPVANGRPLSFTEGFTTGLEYTASLGLWQGVSTRADYAPSMKPCPLVAGLTPGVASVHVDLATVFQNFAPLIDTGLRQAEMSLEALPQEGPFDARPLLETYLDFVRSVIDGAEALDLALVHPGTRIELQGTYTTKEGPKKVRPIGDVTGLLGMLSGGAGMTVIHDGIATSYLEDWEDLIDAGIEVYPEPFRSDLRRLMDMWDELTPLLEPGLVMEADLGAGGMRGTYVVRSSDPKAVAAKLEEMIRQLDHEGGIVRVGAAETIRQGESEARVLPLEVQYEGIVDALRQVEERALQAEGGLEEDEEDTHELEPEKLQEVRKTFEGLLGRSYRMALCSRGKELLVVFGPSDEVLHAALARFLSPSPASPAVQALAARIPAGSHGFSYRVDYGRLFGQMSAALAAITPDAPDLGSLRLTLDIWGGSRGRAWTGGIGMDIGELIDTKRQLEQR